jgi:hypothetical protein
MTFPIREFKSFLQYCLEDYGHGYEMKDLEIDCTANNRLRPAAEQAIFVLEDMLKVNKPIQPQLF